MKTAMRFLTLALLLALGCSMWAQQGNTTSSTNNNRGSDQRPSAPARPAPRPAPQPQPQVKPPVQPQSASTASVGKNNMPKYSGRGADSSVSQSPQASQHPHHGGDRPRYYVGYYYPYTGYVPSYPQTSNDSSMNAPEGDTYAEPDSAPVETNGQYVPPSSGYSPSMIPAPEVGNAPPMTPSVDVSQIQTPPAPAVAENTAILVFKDGHTLEVKGFMIYAGNVVVLTGDVRKIPLASLNLQATADANSDAGYTFRLPAVYRD